MRAFQSILHHLLPRGFVRIRNFATSLTGNALSCCLGTSCSAPQPTSLLQLHRLPQIISRPRLELSVCGSSMRVVERFSAAQLLRSHPALSTPRQPATPAPNMNMLQHPPNRCFLPNTPHNQRRPPLRQPCPLPQHRTQLYLRAKLRMRQPSQSLPPDTKSISQLPVDSSVAVSEAPISSFDRPTASNGRSRCNPPTWEFDVHVICICNREWKARGYSIKENCRQSQAIRSNHGVHRCGLRSAIPRTSPKRVAK
jgi:hypothetical protein